MPGPTPAASAKDGVHDPGPPRFFVAEIPLRIAIECAIGSGTLDDGM